MKKSKPNKVCCVCGKPATEVHMSFMGQIPFHVCELHYKTTGMGWGWCDGWKNNRMGLMDKNGWVDLKYYSKNKES